MTSADRSPPADGRPAGDTRSHSRTATISVPPPGISLASALLAENDATGYNFTRGSWGTKDDLSNPSSTRSLTYLAGNRHNPATGHPT